MRLPSRNQLAQVAGVVRGFPAGAAAFGHIIVASLAIVAENAAMISAVSATFSVKSPRHRS